MIVLIKRTGGEVEWRKFIGGDKVKKVRVQDIGWITNMDVYSAMNNNRGRRKKTLSQLPVL